MKERQATCDGTGSDMIGRKNGAGFGKVSGTGRGPGHGQIGRSGSWDGQRRLRRHLT